MGQIEPQTKKIDRPELELNFNWLEQPANDTVVRNPEATFAKNKREKTVIVIPAYNEERFIGSVVLKAKKYAKAVIVVDDGSCDDTAEIAAETGAVVLRQTCNQGKGAALNAGFKQAPLYNPEVVVTFDADGQHCAEELDKVIDPILMGTADIVIGSRYLKKTSEVPRHRILGHQFFNWFTGLSSGVKSTDSQSGFRAFSRAAIEQIDFSSAGFSVESEMQFIAGRHNLRLVEVPITIRYTDKPKRSAVGQGLTVLNGILRLMGQYRPLLFFGVPGLVVLLMGLFFGIWVVEIYSRIQTLAVGYAMISVLLSVIGMLLLSTGITLHSVRGLIIEIQKRMEK